ncbi:MAG: hypothetical protein M3Y59_04000 [Myxococcota bacterium]|nr:hypothetical protein [Myxococcota bacterium]
MSDKSSALAQQQAQQHPQGERRVSDYHTQEWSSGTRGGGKVPADLGWHTNPKQYQEEYGSSTLDEERNLERERSSKR